MIQISLSDLSGSVYINRESKSEVLAMLDGCVKSGKGFKCMSHVDESQCDMIISSKILRENVIQLFNV